MRIRDLLSENSIELKGVAGSKQEAIDMMVTLMAKSGKQEMQRPIVKAYMPEKKRAQQVLVKELRFHIASQMQ